MENKNRTEDRRHTSGNHEYNYNQPAHYPIKRREFAHGQNRTMNPGNLDDYGDTAYRGFSNRLNTGRDYESNAGYRDNYNRIIERSGRSDGREPGRANQQSGPHRGKGPRSYTRSDARILEDINDYMCDNPYLDASEIDVEVKDGEVVLAGHVENRQSKRLAEDIAENVAGVNNVENRLRVQVKGI